MVILLGYWRKRFLTARFTLQPFPTELEDSPSKPLPLSQWQARTFRFVSELYTTVNFDLIITFTHALSMCRNWKGGQIFKYLSQERGDEKGSFWLCFILACKDHHGSVVCNTWLLHRTHGKYSLKHLNDSGCMLQLIYMYAVTFDKLLKLKLLTAY